MPSVSKPHNPLTAWGMQVKVALIQRGLTQGDLLKHLSGLGYVMDKMTLCRLLYGRGCGLHKRAMEEIDRLFDIPSAGDNQAG